MAAANFKVALSLLVVWTSAVLVLTADLPNVLTEDDLTKLVKDGKRVIANFASGTGKESVSAAAELTKVADILEPDRDVVVGFVVDTETHLKFGVATTPTVIYIRDGVPILYTDEIKADNIVEFVHSDTGRSSVELNDDNFEHLTQAATGATTGDWLVVFQDPEQIESMMLIPTIEAASSVLKGRINVAVVDTTSSPGLVERFSIEETPIVYLLKEATGEWVGFEEEVTLDSILAFLGEEEETKEETVDGAKEKLKKTKEKLDKLAEKVADGAKKFASEAKEKLSEGAKKAKDKIKEQAAKASATLKEGAAKAREKLKEGARKARELLQDKDAQKKIGIGSSIVIGAVVLIVVVVCVRRRKKKQLKEKTQ
ncbi:protein disulfide-isomerase 1-like isoform X1 [Ptychodera flava]|uniref:protein disulfide-isomerase 1-like isoform X1 n=1 Tax=Ptychodera flava TaxID=63121 RepID=UPI00396A97CF